MDKAFKYQIYPSKKQTKLFNHVLEECRWLYNCFLEQRKTSWETERKSISCMDQCYSIVQLKKDRSSLKTAPAQVLQEIAFRIEKTYHAFFRRVRKGEKPGYPRFKGKHRYDSFSYPQPGFKIIPEKKVVKLSKIGEIKIKYHRPIEGIIKTCTIKKAPTGKWFATFSCKVEPKPLTPSNKSIGIDMGLESFATFSNGTKIENPRFFKQEEQKLAKIQRKFSKQEKGTPKRTKLRKSIAHVYENISNKRLDFSHKLSREIINNFGIVSVENLSINEMRKNGFRCVNKSIGDAAWNIFLNFLSYKAEEADRKLIKVNPAYTSQTCSNCGVRHKLELSNRVFHCPSCNFSLDRDRNAAINILTLGMQSLTSTV